MRIDAQRDVGLSMTESAADLDHVDAGVNQVAGVGVPQGVVKLRRCARCTECGHKGATILHPGWGGADVGFQPYPAHKLRDQP